MKRIIGENREKKTDTSIMRIKQQNNAMRVSG